VTEYERFEREQEEAAAREAAAIGGVAGDEDIDPAQRPLVEAGQGDAEGFEEAERDLVEHASHGDMHSARVPYDDRGEPEDESDLAADGGEADRELSSETEEPDR
jgi:hypothetical protein